MAEIHKVVERFVLILDIVTWLGVYQAATPGVLGVIETKGLL